MLIYDIFYFGKVYMANHYSYLDNDDGYLTMYQNKVIDGFIPYVPDVEPRLIQFLRSLYYHKINGIKPCVPLYMEYMIKAEDWDEIVRYIRKYRIRAFSQLLKRYGNYNNYGSYGNCHTSYPY